MVKEENLSSDKTEKLIEDYLFAEREPLREEVLALIDGNKPGLLERKNVGDRIINKILDLLHNCLIRTLIPQIIKIVTDKIIYNHNNQCFVRSIFNSF